MRKLIWCCAVLALGTAAAVYAAAEYADRCPTSLLGQCVITTYRAGTVYNLVCEVSRAAVGETFEAVKKVTDHPEVVPTTVAVIPADPEPAPAEEPACPVPCPMHDCQEKTPCPAPSLGRVIIQPEDEAATDKPQAAPTGGDAEEAEFVPPPMPHAREDAAVPPKMPYATDNTPAEEPETGAVDVLWQLFQEATTHCTDGDGHEASQPHPAGTPDCQEDPQYDEQYPGCPATGRCPRGGCGPRSHCCPDVPGDEPSVEDKAAPAKTDDGTDEQSEPPLKPDVPKGDQGAKGPAHHDIDTTEYRPSDGSPIDYSSYPY